MADYIKQWIGDYMDVVDGCAPFVLTMTLEYSPEDTESLLGFKPQNGTNYYGLYDFPDKSCYYNIMRCMGTLIVNTPAWSIDYDVFEIEKPALICHRANDRSAFDISKV